MFRFEHPEYLYFLLLILLVVGLYALSGWRSGQAKGKLGESELLQQLVPEQSRAKPRFKFILLVLALVALVVAWANPQLGVAQRPAKREAADIYLALDVSRSMLAEDVAPNRLGRAKRLARELVKSIRMERMATILFAGYAYIQTPLTTDFGQVDLLLRSAGPELIEYQGTALGEAIELATQMAPDEGARNSALILFTDGESHEAGWEEKAEKAREKGIRIYAVGLGDPRGAPIPQEEGQQRAFLKDKNGQVVQTHLDVETLERLAEIGGGSYLSAEMGTRTIVNALVGEIEQLEKQEFDQPIYGEYRTYFQYFIGLALLFLLLESLLSFRKGSF
jgi:Ca-activated chloride channel family protein